MMISRLAVCAVALAAMSIPPAWGASVTQKDLKDAFAQVRAIGKAWNTDVNNKTRVLYEQLGEKAGLANDPAVIETLDLAYGSDPKQKLDIHQPAKKGTGRPIVVYVHGGGLTGGDKNNAPGVTKWLAKNGMIGVNANYRLSPQAKWPDGGRDMALLVTWLKQNAKQYGGDPARIFLFGHSAGGRVVAHYLYDQDVQPNGDPGIAGAILMSGSFTADYEGPSEKVSLAYYGADKTQWDRRDPMGQLKSYKGKTVPTLVSTAELDPDRNEHSSIDLLQAICKKSGCPRFTQAMGHNHLSQALHLYFGDPNLGADYLDFIRTTPKSASATVASAK